MNIKRDGNFENSCQQFSSFKIKYIRPLSNLTNFFVIPEPSGLFCCHLCQINKGVLATRARFVKQYHHKRYQLSKYSTVCWVPRPVSLEMLRIQSAVCWENLSALDFRVQYCFNFIFFLKKPNSGYLWHKDDFSAW